MTADELKALAENQEVMKWLEPIPVADFTKFLPPDQITSMIEESKRPLLEKQRELLDEVKRAKDSRNQTTEQLENYKKYLHLLEDYEIGLDGDGKLDYSKVEEVIRKLKSGAADPGAGANSSELAEVRRQLKKAQRDFDGKVNEFALKENELVSLKTEIETRDQYIHNLLISNTMRAALSKAGYPELAIQHLLPSLVAKSGAQVNYDESKEIEHRWSAITDDNRTIEEWVKYWATTEDGLFFMPGRKNIGGGAGGSGGGSTPKSWNDMSPSEKTALYNKDRNLYTQLRDAAKNG